MKPNRINDLYEEFLDGPDLFDVPSLRRKPGRYRSPTVALSVYFTWLVRRLFTVPARLLIPVVLLSSLYATIAVDSISRLLLLFFCVISFFEITLGWIFRPKLEIRRSVPARVRPGTIFRVRFEVRNRRRRPAYNLTFDDFAYAGKIETVKPAGCEIIGGGQSIIAEAECRASKRGEIRLYRPLAESTFPLGLIKWSCRGKQYALIKIHAALAPLKNFTLPQPGGRVGKNTIPRFRLGDSPELAGCRDYRSGDDIRRIDWPGSARRGSLVIKEFAAESRSRVGLYIDTFAPQSLWERRLGRPAARLEKALELGTAVAAHLEKSESPIRFFAAGDRIYPLGVPPGASAYNAVADAICTLEPSWDCLLRNVPAALSNAIVELDAAVLILLDDDDARRNWVQSLAGRGAALKILLVTDDPNADPPPKWEIYPL
ncbi:MAG: DUF58 domain-containing protein [Victivallaceae bacterium]